MNAALELTLTQKEHLSLIAALERAVHDLKDLAEKVKRLENHIEPLSDEEIANLLVI